MRATSEAVEGNKVRLSVHVEESEVDKVLDAAIRTLSRQARVPGFRPGKVPRQVLEARMGGAVALRSEALREAIPDFYAKALAETEVDPISSPEIDITDGQERGDLAFDAVVEVRPLVAIPGYAGLTVTVPSPTVTDADVEAQIDRLRETEAELVEVERPARDGDHVTIDVHGRLASGDEVVASDDFLYEVGKGWVVPELDEQLRGAKVGDVLAFEARTAGADGGDLEIAFRVLVKDVKEKKLPEATDAWAAESSEFQTVADLRADLRDRISRIKVVQAQLSLRQGAIAALAELVDDAEIPDALVAAELQERAQDFSRRLEQQGFGLAQFLEATRQSEADLVEELKGEARRAVKADLALRALAEAEGIGVTDEEVEAELDEMARRLGVEPPVVRERLTRAGRIAAVRSEQRKTKALGWLLDHVEVVDEEGAPVPLADLRVDQGADESGADGAGAQEAAGGTDDGARHEDAEVHAEARTETA